MARKDNKGFWNNYASDLLSRTDRKNDGKSEKYAISDKNYHHWNIVAVGKRMEHTKDELEKINLEVNESKKILQTMANEISATFEVVHSQLTEMVQRLRSARMACNQELRDALKSLNEINSFFMDYDYEKEQKQVERFLKNAKDFKELIDDGTIGAISNIVIKLAVKEE